MVGGHDRQEPTMHASILTFTGDPDDLVARIERLFEQGAAADVKLLLVLRRPDGVTLLDTCPSHEAYLRFRASGWLEGALREVGLPEPQITDHPVQLSIVDGSVAVAAPA
jgi:hypothetical protein